MQKLIGVTCIVAGALLLVWGHSISQSVGSQVQQVFTGSPVNKAVYLYISGAMLFAFGLFQIFWTKK